MCVGGGGGGEVEEARGPTTAQTRSVTVKILNIGTCMSEQTV